ncbi:hypothetical protein ACSSS7_002586 [Eimeria intestinalis]
MPPSGSSEDDDVVEVGEATAASSHARRRKRSSRSSSSSSSSDSSSEEERKRQKKEKKARKRAKKEAKHKKPKKAKEEKKRKKGKADKDNDGAAFGAVGDRWGKYGIIQESDKWSKRPEFTLWLLEVKDRNIEDLSNWEEKKLFSDFVEDFNTATLPHKKYYNLELWEAEERMREAEAAMSKKEKTDFNDEAQRRKEIQMLREQRKQLATAHELQLLRQDREKLSDMREQRLMASKVETLYKLGRNAEAEALAERLKPDT